MRSLVSTTVPATIYLPALVIIVVYEGGAGLYYMELEHVLYMVGKAYSVNNA